MSSNIIESFTPIDFSEITKTLACIQEVIRPAYEVVQHLREIMRPLVEVVEQYKPVMTELEDIATAAIRPLSAIDKLGKVQYVCWDYMTSDFIDDIISEDNTNKVLREHLSRDKYKKVISTIERSRDNPVLKNHQNLYNQSIMAFQNGYNDLAVTGLTSVFDGILADISKNPTHSFKPRIGVIREKLEKDEILDHDEYAMLTLALTFEKTLYSFSASIDFSQKEPKDLNRHWIAHGRSLRKKTKLDCVKMINMIYGLLLIEELDAQTFSE